MLDAFRFKLERALGTGGPAAVDALIARLRTAIAGGADAVRALMDRELAGAVSDIVDPAAPENHGAGDMADLMIDPERVGRLEYYIQSQAMAERDRLIGKDEVGGDRLAEALKGESYLGALSDEEKHYLVQRALRVWVFSPASGEDGGGENLDALTAAFRGDPQMAPWLADNYMYAANVIYEAQGDVRGTPGTFGSWQVRNLHTELWREAALVAPDFFMDEGLRRLGGDRAGKFLTGAMRKDIGPRSSDYDRRNPYFKGLGPDEQAVLVDAAARRDADPDRTNAFLQEVFAATGEDHVESAERQAIWARALARIVPVPEGREIDREALHSRMAAVLETGGGRQLLFGKAIPAPLKSWALTQFAPPPDGAGWTAADLAAGWESPAVATAFGARALDQAKGTAPLTFDPAREKAAMHNAIGQALGLPPDNLPPENETDEQRAARLEAGFDHPYYSDSADGPIKLIQGHVAELGGTPKIIQIPITYTSNDNGAAVFKVLRIESENGVIFVDNKGNRYTDAGHWEGSNELPPGKLTFPAGLSLDGSLRTIDSPANDDWVWGTLDIVAMAAGTVAGIALIVGSGGTAAPLVVGLAAAYSGARGTAKLVDRAGKGHDLSDVTDPTTRGLLLETASSVLAVTAIGGGVRAARLLQQGSKMSRMGANLVSGMTVAGSLADAAAMTDGIAQLSLNWDRMTPEQKSMALLQLAFQAGMGAASAKAGGGRFTDGFNFKRTRNQLEHGSPYDLGQVKNDPAAARFADLQEGQVAVAYDMRDGKPVNIRLVYKGDAPPGREMIELHSRAAASMEASDGLINRFLGLCPEGGPPRGSAAWEAIEEMKKIRGESRMLLDQLNGGKATDAEKAWIETRLNELNGALIDERRRLDHWETDGRGYVASPAQGEKDAGKLDWPHEAYSGSDPYDASTHGDTYVPPGHHWKTQRPDSEIPKLVQHDRSLPAYRFEGGRFVLDAPVDPPLVIRGRNRHNQTVTVEAGGRQVDLTIGADPKVRREGTQTVETENGPADFPLGTAINAKGEEVRLIKSASRIKEIVANPDGTYTMRRWKTDRKKTLLEVTYDADGFPMRPSKVDVYIRPDAIQSGNPGTHFRAANEELLAAIDADPTLAGKLGLDPADIRANMSESPHPYTWHHHQQVGRMQLVPFAVHDKFSHSGGMSIWGEK